MAITYAKFIKNHVNKAMDFDGIAGAQCVDLIKYYLKEVFDIIAGAWGDAHAYYDNFNKLPLLKKNFTRIANTPSFVPKKGDIVVWSPSLSSGGWGHIAIATGEGNTKEFYSYDQNWTGNHDACTKIKHNYNCVYGVLRPKDQSRVDGAKIMDKSGAKYGDKSLGILSFKMLLLIAYKLGMTKYKVGKDNGFGKGTKAAVNELLKKWGYAQNGIVGVKFVKKLHTEIEKRM